MRFAPPATAAIASAIALASVASIAAAQSQPSITTTVAQPRALALAGLDAVPAFGAAAAQSNPAALAELGVAAMALAHRVVGPGVAQQSGVVAVPWRGRATFALGFDVQRVDGRPTGNALTTGTNATYAARGGVHAAMPLAGGMSVGAGVARYSSTLAVETARGWCADAGLHWRRAGWRAGAALRGWSFGDEATTDVHAWSAGAARGWNGLDLAAQVDGGRTGGVGSAAGVVWHAARPVELRAGARHGADDGTSFGAGLAVAAGGAQLEWGSRFGSSVATEHVVGLTIAFGDAPVVQPVPRKTKVVGAAAAPAAPARAAEQPTPPARAVTPPVASAPQKAPVAAPVQKAPQAVAAPGAAITTTTTTTPVPAAAPRAVASTPVAGSVSPGVAPSRTGASTPDANSVTPSSAPARTANTFARPVAPAQTVAPEERVEDTAPKPPPCYAVFAGTHRTLETAATEIFRLKGADIYPRVERRGDDTIVVLARCVSLADATALQKRAQRAGVRCSVTAE